MSRISKRDLELSTEQRLNLLNEDVRFHAAESEQHSQLGQEADREPPRSDNSNCCNHASHKLVSLLNLMNKIEAIADENRCKARLLSRNNVLFANPSLWPIILSKIKNKIAMAAVASQAHNRLIKEGSGESMKTAHREANTIFSLLRENLFRGILSN